MGCGLRVNKRGKKPKINDSEQDICSKDDRKAAMVTAGAIDRLVPGRPTLGSGSTYEEGEGVVREEMAQLANGPQKP